MASKFFYKCNNKWNCLRNFTFFFDMIWSRCCCLNFSVPIVLLFLSKTRLIYTLSSSVYLVGQIIILSKIKHTLWLWLFPPHFIFDQLYQFFKSVYSHLLDWSIWKLDDLYFLLKAMFLFNLILFHPSWKHFWWLSY